MLYLKRILSKRPTTYRKNLRLAWREDKVLIATGTAFPAVEYQNYLLEITQCNKALVFPGIGLGILEVHASHLSKGVICGGSLMLKLTKTSF